MDPKPNPPPKAWYQSKTMWLNGFIFVAALTVAVLGAFQANDYQFTPEAITAMILAAANLVLRLQTNTGVTLNPPAETPTNPPTLDG